MEAISRITRKSLHTRIVEACDRLGWRVSTVTQTDGRLGYYVEGDGPSYTPGELAAKLGIPVMDDGSWR